MRSRSAGGVSPVRTAARMPTSGRPSAASPALDAGQRLLQVLADVVGQRLQRRHVEHVNLVGEPARPSRTSSSIADRKAASVLPEPVGAAISAWRRCEVTAQACCLDLGRLAEAASPARRKRPGGTARH
jgi:hypothetical protein